MWVKLCVSYFENIITTETGTKNVFKRKSALDIRLASNTLWR